MNVILNAERTEAMVDGMKFKVGENIEYRAADSEKIGMGRITELKHPGYQQSEKESVWMCVADITEGTAEWISCVVYKQQHDAGIFSAMKPLPLKQTNNEPLTANTSNEPNYIPPVENDLW